MIFAQLKFLAFLCICSITSSWITGLKMSMRVEKTEKPYIEDVLETYASLPDMTLLALGSVYWNPPEKSVSQLAVAMQDKHVNKYGSILGEPALRDHLSAILANHGFDMSANSVTVTAGANQAFANAALAICDDGDDAIVIAPYYFGHRMSLELSGAKIRVCPFVPATLAPDWAALEALVAEHRPKMIVLTSPNNPSGYVYSDAEIQRIVDLAKTCDAWLVADQTYHEFLYDDAVHVFPGTEKSVISYDKIVHVFSFSKIFGMPGWRVGYLVFPNVLTDHMRKLQDAIPTHTAILCQKLALNCLQEHYPLDNLLGTHNTAAGRSVSPDAAKLHRAREHYSAWAQGTIATLEGARAALWPVLQPLGTVYTKGAFYFLVPVPERILEEEAVDILARQFGVLLMHGTPFGAPNHMRLSYGSIPPPSLLGAIDKIRRGIEHLQELSRQRVRVTSTCKL